MFDGADLNLFKVALRECLDDLDSERAGGKRDVEDEFERFRCLTFLRSAPSFLLLVGALASAAGRSLGGASRCS